MSNSAFTNQQYTTPVSLTTQVSGTLPVGNGGTGTGSPSITAFNNITNFTAAGTTGSTSSNLVFSSSPTLTTPVLGVATATSLNGLTITTTTGTFTLTNAKTLSVSNTLTLSGTDGTTMTFPTTSATLARTDAANTFTGHQTIEGVTSTGATGTGRFVFDNTPTLITPVLGVATGTRLTITDTVFPAWFINNNDNANVSVLFLDGDRATPTNNDAANMFLRLSNSAGTQTAFGYITWQAVDVTAGSEDGRINIGILVNGANQELSISSTALKPTVNDTFALGSTGESFADLFLASGGTINYNNGNVVITHSAGKLAITGGALGVGGTPSTSTIAEFTSTTGAVLLPRMTTTQRDNLTPLAGMIIYNTSTAKLNVYTTGWEAVTSA